MCNRLRGQLSPYKCAALKRVQLTSNVICLFCSFGPAISGSKVTIKKIALPATAKVAATSSHFQQRAIRTNSDAADHGSEQSNGGRPSDGRTRRRNALAFDDAFNGVSRKRCQSDPCASRAPRCPRPQRRRPCSSLMRREARPYGSECLNEAGGYCRLASPDRSGVRGH